MLRGLWNWGEIFPLPRKNAEKAVFQAILWGKQIFKLGDSREKSITYRFRKGLISVNISARPKFGIGIYSISCNVPATGGIPGVVVVGGIGPAVVEIVVVVDDLVAVQIVDGQATIARAMVGAGVVDSRRVFGGAENPEAVGVLPDGWMTLLGYIIFKLSIVSFNIIGIDVSLICAYGHKAEPRSFCFKA